MKKILSLALSLALIFSCIFVIPFSASAETEFTTKNFCAGAPAVTVSSGIDLTQEALVLRPDKVHASSRNADMLFCYGCDNYDSAGSPNYNNGLWAFFKFTDDGLKIMRTTWNVDFTIPKADQYVISFEKLYNGDFVAKINNTYYKWGSGVDTYLKKLTNDQTSFSNIALKLKSDNGNVDVSYKTQAVATGNWIRKAAPTASYTEATADGYDDYLNLTRSHTYSTNNAHDITNEIFVMNGVNITGNVSNDNRFVMVFSKSKMDNGNTLNQTDRIYLFVVKTANGVKITMDASMASALTIDPAQYNGTLWFTFANGGMYVNNEAVTDQNNAVKNFLNGSYKTETYISIYNESTNTQNLSVKFVDKNSGDWNSTATVRTKYNPLDSSFSYVLTGYTPPSPKIITNEKHNLLDEIVILKGMKLDTNGNRIQLAFTQSQSDTGYAASDAVAQTDASNGKLHFFVTRTADGLVFYPTASIANGTTVPFDADDTYSFYFVNGKDLYVNDTKLGDNAYGCIKRFVDGGNNGCYISLMRESSNAFTVSSEFIVKSEDKSENFATNNATKLYDAKSGLWKYNMNSSSYISSEIKHNALDEYFVVKGLNFDSGRVCFIFNNSQTATGSNGADGTANIDKCKNGRLFLYFTAVSGGYKVSLTDNMGSEATVPSSDDGYILHFENGSLYINGVKVNDRNTEIGGYIKSFVNSDKTNCYFTIKNDGAPNQKVLCEFVTKTENDWKSVGSVTSSFAGVNEYGYTLPANQYVITRTKHDLSKEEISFSNVSTTGLFVTLSTDATANTTSNNENKLMLNITKVGNDMLLGAFVGGNLKYMMGATNLDTEFKLGFKKNANGDYEIVRNGTAVSSTGYDGFTAGMTAINQLLKNSTELYVCVMGQNDSTIGKLAFKDAQTGEIINKGNITPVTYANGGIAFGSYNGTDTGFNAVSIQNASDVSVFGLKLSNLDIATKTPESGINNPNTYNQAICVMLKKDNDTNISVSGANTLTLMLRQIEDTDKLAVAVIGSAGTWQVVGTVDAAAEYNIRLLQGVSKYYLLINDNAFNVPEVNTFASATGDVHAVVAKGKETNKTAISAKAVATASTVAFSQGDINLDGNVNILDLVKMKKTLANYTGFSAGELANMVQFLIGAYSETSPKSLFVSDYGAKGDGVSDDTIAIQAAVNALKSAPSGSTLTFQNKTYYAPTDKNVPVISLTETENKKIIGNGATILSEGTKPYMYFSKTEDCSVEGLNFDLKTRAHFVGTVTNKNTTDKYLDVTADRDIGLTGEWTANNDEFALSDIGKTSRAYLFLDKIQTIDAQNRQYRIYINKDNKIGTNTTFGEQKNGDKIIIPTPGIGHKSCDSFRVMSNSNALLKDINVYSAPSFVFHVNGNKDVLTFDNVNVKPADDESVVFTNWRDAFHCKTNSAKIIWNNCTCKGSGDDVINISANMMYVKTLNSATDITCGCPITGGAYGANAVKAGDSVVVWNTTTGMLIGRTTIKSVIDDSTNRYELNDTLSGLAAGENIKLCIENHAAPNSEVNNCDFEGTIRFRGTTTITNTTFNLMKMWIDTESNIEGPVPHDITFKNCTFSVYGNTGAQKHFVISAYNPNSTYASGMYRLENIVFDGCTGLQNYYFSSANLNTNSPDYVIIK